MDREGQWDACPPDPVNPLDRIKAISAEITHLDGDIAQAVDELSMLHHIDDDATRDAAVLGTYDDRAAAKMTRGDVLRMQKQVHNLERSRSKLVAKRDRLISKLASL